jgi:hypothetical protein
MKMPQIAAMDSRLRRAEENFITRAEFVFRSYPELVSFCLNQEAEALKAPAQNDAEGQQFDLQVGLIREVSTAFEEEICQAVSELILDVVQERPEMLSLLSGRTFARVVH